MLSILKDYMVSFDNYKHRVDLEECYQWQKGIALHCKLHMSPARISLTLRNLVFVVLQPGIVAGLIPFLIAKNSFKHALSGPFLFHHFLGSIVFLAGAFVMFHCIARFIIDGLGTLSPADPTKRLVISGLYKFSRNPMYIGVMLMLIGEVVFALSGYLLLYSIGIFTLFNLFVAYREEPRLRKDFGEDYEIYCRKVGRWI